MYPASPAIVCSFLPRVPVVVEDGLSASYGTAAADCIAEVYPVNSPSATCVDDSQTATAPPAVVAHGEAAPVAAFPSEVAPAAGSAVAALPAAAPLVVSVSVVLMVGQLAVPAAVWPPSLVPAPHTCTWLIQHLELQGKWHQVALDEQVSDHVYLEGLGVDYMLSHKCFVSVTDWQLHTRGHVPLGALGVEYLVTRTDWQLDLHAAGGEDQVGVHVQPDSSVYKAQSSGPTHDGPSA